MSDPDSEIVFDDFFYLAYSKELEAKDAERRLIIIDAPNIMYSASNFSEVDSKPDASSLLVVIRYFIMNDFDVHCFSNHKYKESKIVKYNFIIEKLIELKMYTVLPENVYDDSAMINFCDQSDGVILSHDQFRDHLSHSDAVIQNRLNDLIINQVLSPRFDPLHNSKVEWNKTFDAHFVTDFKITFNVPMDKLHALLYAYPNSMRYEIVKEFRAPPPGTTREKRKTYLLDQIDVLFERCKRVRNREMENERMAANFVRPQMDEAMAELQLEEQRKIDAIDEEDW